MPAKTDFPPHVIAALLGITERRLQQLHAEGWIPRGEGRGTYPMVGSVQGYIKYLREHARATGRGSEHARLARAQAIKVEMENYRRAGQYVLHEHALELLTTIATELASGLEAIPSRIANDLASIEDPGIIRQRLQDEHRGVRERLSHRVAEFAQQCQVRADDLENAPTDGAPDTEPMGRGEQDPPAQLSASGPV